MLLKSLRFVILSLGHLNTLNTLKNPVIIKDKS